MDFGKRNKIKKICSFSNGRRKRSPFSKRYLLCFQRINLARNETRDFEKGNAPIRGCGVTYNNLSSNLSSSDRGAPRNSIFSPPYSRIIFVSSYRKNRKKKKQVLLGEITDSSPSGYRYSNTLIPNPVSILKAIYSVNTERGKFSPSVITTTPRQIIVSRGVNGDAAKERTPEFHRPVGRK